jgi:hypothetical protein
VFRTLALNGFAALTLTTAAMAQDAPTVKSVEVAVELEAIGNPAAAAYWTTVADDLENAVVARITDQIADDGVKINIDLEEVSLSGGLTEKLGLAETRLVGNVVMTHDSDNGRFGAYMLTVDVNSAAPMFPPEVDIATLPADSRVYYDAMIAAFAQGVVDRLM